MLPFTFTGQVIRGERVGRTIGFPTANLDFAPDKKNLTPGVYLGECELIQEKKVIKKNLQSLIYFGPRYIFGEKKNNFEVYLYNFNQQIYDFTLSGELTQKIRDPLELKNLKELKVQLEKDKIVGLQLLKKQNAHV